MKSALPSATACSSVSINTTPSATGNGLRLYLLMPNPFKLRNPKKVDCSGDQKQSQAQMKFTSVQLLIKRDQLVIMAMVWWQFSDHERMDDGTC